MIILLVRSRFQSSRLPGKPLLKFGNDTMIQKVYQQTVKSKFIDKVYVLTDDIRVKESIEEINGKLRFLFSCVGSPQVACCFEQDKRTGASRAMNF